MTAGNKAENHKERYKTKKRNVSEICKFQTLERQKHLTHLVYNVSKTVGK